MKGTAKSTTFSRSSVMVKAATAMSARFRDEKENTSEKRSEFLPLIRYCQRLTKVYLISNFH